MNFRKRVRSRKTSVSLVANAEKWSQIKRASRWDQYAIQESDDDDPQYHEIRDWVEEFFRRKSNGSAHEDDIEVKLTKKQTLILSTLVPDEILFMEKYDTTEQKRFVGVLLMADVSGYTALSERYNNTGKGGTYRLTVTLNTYLGSLVELIYSHGGDILKFAGDAFLALWKTDKKTFLCHTIHTVITCALIIQHSYAIYETDVKVNLKVKLAISAGNLIFAPIGTGIDMNYVIYGLPVLEAKVAESVCASGEVKVSPTAWGHCYSRNYDHIVHEDGHVTIKSILYDPREKDVTKPFTGFGPLMNQYKRFAIENFPEYLWKSPDNLEPAEIHRRNEILSLRKSILHAEINNIGSEIRKFMIRPVLTQIDAHQPLEYLTEMRQVSVLFMTLKPKECTFPQLITIVNNAYVITCEIVYKLMGCVNKIVLFDKDVMVLVIFGLRGFKHESEAQAALKCAYSIKKSVSILDGVQEVSIGVTTGQVYCGVVGHPLRKEFTVIGAVVNKAARLMCGFRNKITCDETTFIKSKMSSNSFTLQNKIELKGIVQPGKIYEYSEDIRVKELYNIPMTPPLLNRKDELEYFNDWLDNTYSSYRDFDALLIVGDSRIGKSRLLSWMDRVAQSKGLKTGFITLTSVHSATPYLGLSQIINKILDLPDDIVGFEKEEKIVNLIKAYSDDLCYLNKIIKVRFAYHEGVNLLNEQKRTQKAQEMFFKLISSIIEKHVIFLDDLQNLDASSWEYICMILRCKRIFTVISVTRQKFSTMQDWLYNAFIEQSIRKIVLGPLSTDMIAPLACQILDVNAVPKDLCNALKKKSNGMPGQIENFIIHLFSTGAIEIHKTNINEIENWSDEKLLFPDSQLLHPQAINVNDQSTLDQHIQENASEDIAICTVVKKEELDANIDIQNIDALVMIQIDSLTPYQQLLLKIASVIGNVIPRDLLENIMYDNDTITTAKSVKGLFGMRIFTCANLKSLSSRFKDINLECDCYFEYDSENCENLPKYAFCKVMKFCNKNTRQICYELLPLNQKKEFHSRIVHHLETNKQKCLNCGGALTVIQSTTNLNFKADETELNYMIYAESDDPGDTDDDSEIISITRNLSLNNDIPDSTSTVKKSLSEPLPQKSIISQTPTIKTDSQVLHKDSSRASIKENIVNNEKINRVPSKRVTISGLQFQVSPSDSSGMLCKIFDTLRPILEADNIADWHSMGIKDSLDNLTKESFSKNSISIKIEQGISKTNVHRCSCSELSILICEQLIHHAQQAEMKFEAVQYLIRFCYLNLIMNDFNVILPRLKDAENICVDKLTLEDSINSFDKQRFLAKIFTIRSAVLLITGKLMASKLEIEKAAKIYRIKFDKVSGILKFASIISTIKRKHYRINEILLKTDSLLCLNVATVLFSSLGDDYISRLCASRAIEILQHVNCSVIDTCDAYSNAIQVELDRLAIDSIEDIEKMASQSLKRLLGPVQMYELFAVGKLFIMIFRARIARAEISASIRSAFRAITVSKFLQADSITLDIIPDLFYVLLSRRRIEEALDILKLTLRLDSYPASRECETWYYALCMDMILDAGFQLESPNDISRFAETNLDIEKNSSPGRRRLIVGLWTYWMRANFAKKAKKFEAEALEWSNHESDSKTMTTILSALRLVEGMIESLAGKLDDLKKIVDLMELRSVADRELTRIEKDARVVRSIYPRWVRLKANSLKISGRIGLANNMYNQSLEESQRIYNHLEASLATAAISSSKMWMQNARNGRFLQWQAGVEHALSSWHQLLYRISTTRQ